MKERPILFQGAMVRALLAGTKTQTRRAIKPQPSGHHWQCVPGYELRHTLADLANGAHGVRFHHTIPQNRAWDSDPWVKCPYYGQPGDRLWVREAWAPAAEHGLSGVLYRADFGDEPRTIKYKPSIHMPRWASRILLEVTEVRVQRLQEISPGDSISEGIGFEVRFGGHCLPDGSHFHATDPRQSYFSLWESINGAGSVERNDWVWAVSFRRVQP